MIDEREVRLRCIEAAAKTPTVHPAGHAAGVLATAESWAAWVLGQSIGDKARQVLGLPNKK